ncbi:LuxR family two component transcriptional regulator [Streptomyces sp. 3211.6]|uniref:response regulator transcription factor n=1 Tax=Streptomyces TaxID=1883 RepID=UPI0009A53A9F|nr:MULTISPECIES: response regulator transcription factor [Streptomyces]RKS96927.1 LuxR family two component transcriptional regulator [Streptomyces sp. 3211.6]RPF25323.1 LuxR family two component transcriptional regulator [Streptomyces sp. Ag109_G2-6]
MIRVMLAEDLYILRRALASLLALESDLDVVAEVESGHDILPTARRLRPDVAVLDIDLPGVDGITAAAALHEELPECRVLILTSLGKPGTLRRALEARVCGFLPKDAEPARLTAAIRAVAEGQRVVDPQLALSALDGGHETPLTPRETEVLELAARGEGAKQIASRLFLSVGTVRNYLTSSVNKLGARNRVDAIRIARESGWM